MEEEYDESDLHISGEIVCKVSEAVLNAQHEIKETILHHEDTVKTKTLAAMAVRQARGYPGEVSRVDVDAYNEAKKFVIKAQDAVIEAAETYAKLVAELIPAPVEKVAGQ